MNSLRRRTGLNGRSLHSMSRMQHLLCKGLNSCHIKNRVPCLSTNRNLRATVVHRLQCLCLQLACHVISLIPRPLRTVRRSHTGRPNLAAALLAANLMFQNMDSAMDLCQARLPRQGQNRCLQMLVLWNFWMCSQVSQNRNCVRHTSVVFCSGTQIGLPGMTPPKQRSGAQQTCSEESKMRTTCFLNQPAESFEDYEAHQGAIPVWQHLLKTVLQGQCMMNFHERSVVTVV